MSFWRNLLSGCGDQRYGSTESNAARGAPRPPTLSNQTQARTGDYRRLGVVFDIDALNETYYGRAAYKMVFDAIVPQHRSLLADTKFWDGDTEATLRGETGGHPKYVIALGKKDPRDLARLQRLVRR